jgi:signal transduction histidine kinase
LQAGVLFSGIHRYLCTPTALPSHFALKLRAGMPLITPSLRTKLILFTVIPVIIVYVILYTIGIPHVRDRARVEAQQSLVAHARYQAARLSLELSKIPLLATGLGDLFTTAPKQPQTTLYAHLIDGLRRTPLANAASMVIEDGKISAQMRRGAPSGTTLPNNMQLEDFRRGWQQLAGLIRFNLPVIKQSQTIGYVWVDLLPQDIQALLESATTPGVELFFDGAEKLGEDTEGLNDIVDSARQATPDLTHQVHNPQTDADYWLVRTALPGLPLSLTAVTATETALAPVRRKVSQIIAALLLSLVAIVAIIGTVARKITEPLRLLDESVQRIGAGEFDAVPVVQSRDEIGRLSDAIGQMASLLANREQQLKTSRNVLEKRVTERTAALQSSNQQLLQQIRETRATEQALRLAKTDAEQASRAKSEFLSNISHELRTPLHGVLGNTQLLRREVMQDPARQQSLLAIERCGQHLSSLINQLLDLSKIEAGRAEPELQELDLRRLLDDTRLIMHQRASEKGLELTVDAAADLPRRIVADKLKLKQVLLNLLDNAIKFTAHGKIMLQVEPADSNSLQFSVSDTGAGIPPEEIERVFEPFHQYSGDQRPEGAGLGLAINTRLIDQLQGAFLPVESRPGIGSRFAFRIPTRPPTRPASPVSAAQQGCAPADATATDPQPDGGIAPDGETFRMEENPTALPAPTAWPEGLAQTAGTRIKRALNIGDIEMLAQITRSLALESEIPAADLQHLERLTRDFDIDGLRRFAEDLQNRARSTEPE